jgi:hypothetical protein
MPSEPPQTRPVPTGAGWLLVGLLIPILAGCGSAVPPSAACPVTSFETIPPNDVVGWDEPTWQQASEGLWGHPYLDAFTPDCAFRSSESQLKILWWVLDGRDVPVVLTVESLNGGSFSATYSFDAPGHDRRDRPTGISTPPPGCYSIGITVGSMNGTIVDRVAP